MNYFKDQRQSNSLSGNVLLIILAGILLSALVAETVTSFLSDTRDVGEDRARVLVTQLEDQENDIRNAYNMLRCANGCEVEEINFSPTADTAYNTNSPESGRCSIYHPQGGGLSHKSTPQEVHHAQNYPYEQFWQEHAGIQIEELGNDDSAASPCNGCEMTLILYNVTDDVCRQVNFNRMGLRTIYEIAAANTMDDENFDGVFGSRSVMLGAADEPALVGQRAFCVRVGGLRNNYISVLEVR